MNVHFCLIPSSHSGPINDLTILKDKVGSYNFSFFSDIVAHRKTLHNGEQDISRYLFTDSCDVSVVKVTKYNSEGTERDVKPGLPNEFSIEVLDTTSSALEKQIYSEVFELFKDKIWNQSRSRLIGDYKGSYPGT